jgi:hypothetical protein
MNLSMHNHALLRGILAGAVVLSGASACSRYDRAGAARDTTQPGAVAVTPSDSHTSVSAPQPSADAATQSSADTAMTTVRDTARATAQAWTPHQRTRPSSRRAGQGTTVRSGEAAVSGYRGMERDTSSPEMAGTGAATPLDPAGVTSDYALTTDTTTAGYSEMARDPSAAAGRGDTAAVAVADTTTPAESDTAQANTTTAVHTDTLTVASADSADTASAKREQAAGQVAKADTLQDNSGRIRPPEDSTEIAGNVTGDTTSAASGNVANQSETERIRPPEDSTETVTGIDAVSLMSRAGARCVVKDDSSDVWWDMTDSPAALNPCGTGTMTLSLVRTGEK